MTRYKTPTNQSGQALVTLLVFVASAILITSGAVAVAISNAKSTTLLETSAEVYQSAEAGIENAVLQLERNPAYTGETITVGNQTVTIAVTGSPPTTITATSTGYGSKRTIEAIGMFTNYAFVISSWKELD